MHACMNARTFHAVSGQGMRQILLALKRLDGLYCYQCRRCCVLLRFAVFPFEQIYIQLPEANPDTVLILIDA